jgi:hypothetical protein
MDPWIDGMRVFLATVVGCSFIGRLRRGAPRGRDVSSAETFRAHMTQRAVHFLGRAACVLVVLGVAVGPLGADPVGSTVGVIAGWLIPAALEARNETRRMPGRDLVGARLS